MVIELDLMQKALLFKKPRSTMDSVWRTTPGRAVFLSFETLSHTLQNPVSSFYKLTIQFLKNERCQIFIKKKKSRQGKQKITGWRMTCTVS